MPDYSITLSPEVPGSMAEEFAQRVHYAAAEIRRFSLVRGPGGEVREIEVSTADDADPDEIGRKLNLVVRRDVLPQGEIEDVPVVWQSMAVPRPSLITFADVEDAGLVTRMGDGAYAASGALARLLSALDERVRVIAAERFGAVENHYPALIPTDVLHRAGYFDSFPQFLMTAGRFHSDADVYQGFATQFEAAGDKAAFMDSRTGHTGYCLSPTVCYHTYHQLAGTRVPADGSVLTASGKIFRFESSYHRTLERLWDFTMREVVFLGSRGAVTELRQALVEAVCRLVDELRLAGHLEVANDPFFSNGATAKRVMVQRALRMKYELRMPVVEDRTIAVGSFNLHGSKFGEAFDITTPDGSPAYSGCIGIGMERIAYAFLCRHGIDPSGWPEI
jgi:seryl-tRNA synthetase